MKADIQELEYKRLKLISQSGLDILIYGKKIKLEIGGKLGLQQNISTPLEQKECLFISQFSFFLLQEKYFVHRAHT